MTIVKISELTELTTPADGDMLPIVDVSEALDINKNKKISFLNLLRSTVSNIIHRRQGGSATDWNTGGTTNYTPSASAKIQTGITSAFAINNSYSNGYFASITITFPTAYTNKPFIIATAFQSAGGTGYGQIMDVTDITITNTQVTIMVITANPSKSAIVSWIAIGE